MKAHKEKERAVSQGTKENTQHSVKLQDESGEKCQKGEDNNLSRLDYDAIVLQQGVVSVLNVF